MADVAGISESLREKFFDKKVWGDYADISDRDAINVLSIEMLTPLLLVLDVKIMQNIAENRKWNEGVDEVIKTYIAGATNESDISPIVLQRMLMYLKGIDLASSFSTIFAYERGLASNLYGMGMTRDVLEFDTQQLWPTLNKQNLPQNLGEIATSIQKNLEEYVQNVDNPITQSGEELANALFNRPSRRNTLPSWIAEFFNKKGATTSDAIMKVFYKNLSKLVENLSEEQRQIFDVTARKIDEENELFKGVKTEISTPVESLVQVSLSDELPTNGVKSFTVKISLKNSN